MKYLYLPKSAVAYVLGLWLLLAALLPADLCAQEVVRQLEVKKIKKNHYLYVIGGQGNSVFTGSTEENYLQPERKFSAMHVNLEQEDIHREVLQAESKSDILYTFYYGNRLLTLEYDDKPLDNGRYMLRLAAYNDQLALASDIKDTVLLTSNVFRYDFSALFRNYLSSQSGKWRRSYIFNHQLSPDAETALVMLDNPFQTTSPRPLYFFTLDKALTQVKQHTISLPGAANHMVLEDYVLGNDGKVYLLAAGFQDDNFKKQAATFRYHLYSYEPQTETLLEMELDMDKHFVTNLGLTLDKDQQPLLAGLYSGDDADVALAGTVFFRPEADGNILQATFTALDNEIAERLNENKKEGKESKVDEYSIRHIFPEENGDLTFFAEHYSRRIGVGVKLSLRSGVSPEPQLEDHYGNILAVRLKQDGVPAWSQVINKSQKSVGENIIFNSFALCRNGSTYGLAFNEQVKNMSDVKWVELNPEGEISEKTIFDRKEDRLRIAPMLASSTGNGHLMLPAARFGKNLLLSIDF